MCGIAGLLGVTGDTDRAAVVGGMCSVQTHRGPDDDGLWHDDASHCTLGHRRLSIIDLSPTGSQPMVSADERWVVSFNGEIYDHRSLRSELEAGGHRFRGTSDTEVLVEAIAAWGFEPALSRLNGMFAIGAFDRRERKLHLARDPLGEKPLYWVDIDGGIAFASELGALRRCPGVPNNIDQRSIALYFRLGYIPAPFTALTGVRKLAAGHRLEVRLGEPPAVTPYWDATALLGRQRLPEEESFAEIERLLTDSVRLRLDADVPVGVFLSSGVDSTCIAALATQVTDRVRTFTVGFDEPSVDESDHAAEIARHLGTEHHTLSVSADAGLDLVDLIAPTYGEPFADPSALPTMLLSSAAREHVTVCLSGDGGDEVFGGYNRYLLGSAAWDRVGRMPAPLRRAGAAAVERIDPAWADRLLRPDRGPRALRIRNAGDKLERLATLLRTKDELDLAQRLVAVWPDRLPVEADPHATVFDHPPAALAGHDVVEELMYLDTVTTLPDQMLTKVDRASMRSSLEVRVPLLDPRVVAAAWRAPDSQRLSDGQTKRALRRIAAAHVPREVLDRPKIGFDPPLGRWLRGPLRPWAEDLLAPAAIERHGLDVDVVRPLWNRYLIGRPSDYRVWSVLMYQAWAEQAAT
ncbi:asparagine synthase (glutamine-hydrolyzing) [Acidimicrobiia bacterium EGI L10123]|uniref:asparagine synthase (glutamine-hydrolyzing) n=1 Tax=Salinilacustrithrix flava TaxID=2957203 RepID=UPI003D7C2340|nr:asparagine synthase (glutamine-hydrolyzing) [Acidimicrobiia bacterium EGI L10123]